MSEEYPVYLTTPPTRSESQMFNRTPVGGDQAFQRLGAGNTGLLRRHFTPAGSLQSSQTYIWELFIALGGESELIKWKSVTDKVKQLTVCLTHLFSAKKGAWLGRGLLSRLRLGITEATGTGYWDDVHQKTSGFLFMLAHFGHPFDLKHLSVYGKESLFSGWYPEQGESYAQRRFVCLDEDVGLYESGLVMIHDAVWPRHLMGTSKAREGVSCEAIYENVNTGVRLFGELPKLGRRDYDPHQATQSNDYIRAEVLRLQRGTQTTEIRPLDSIVAGSCFREAVSLEVVRFATLLGKAPSSLNDWGTLIPFINEWIRPQAMLPWEVRVPGNENVQGFDLWGMLPFEENESPEDVERYLIEHYKKVGNEWQPLLGLSSRKVGGRFETELPFQAPYYRAQQRQAAKGGLRAFGWPKQKYARKDVRTIGAKMTDVQNATGERSEYQGLWNGLPELAAYSASLKKDVELDRRRAGRTSTIIHPFEESSGQVSLPWNQLPVDNV
jgi:hypothetical protein